MSIAAIVGEMRERANNMRYRVYINAGAMESDLLDWANRIEAETAGEYHGEQCRWCDERQAALRRVAKEQE